VTAAQLWFLAPAAALFLGLIALATLGSQVLERGVVFIDLAVAQAAACAVLWAGTVMDQPAYWQTQLLASAGALACSAAVAMLSRRWPAQREALIGLLSVMGASAALLGAQSHPQGREQLGQLLAADVLWAGWPQVALLGVCALLVLVLRRQLGSDGVFFPLFALVASLAVPVLGLLLVFALLIAPALWLRVGARPAAVWAGSLGTCALALFLSWQLDLPSGACAVLCLSVFGALSAFKPRLAAG
jgi:zinc/manganese transport system permease protein